jgi:flagellar biosynthetic protein FliR
MSSPFLVVSIAILVGSGILSRLMPNLQVFFVVTPAQILVMFCILYIVIIAMLEKVVEVIGSTMYLVI